MMLGSREDLLSYAANPPCSSSPIPRPDHTEGAFLPRESSNSHIASASSSLQNGSCFLNEAPSMIDWEYGFFRPGFKLNPLVGTVQFYERHVFLCYKSPSVWPPRIEASEFDRLPRLLSAAVTARKIVMKKETRLTICEGHDGTEISNGDILIFPDMIRYRRLTHFDVDTFVEEVLVKNGKWLPGTPERLRGSYIFVCSHGSRDRRCGTCGPILVNRFNEEIQFHGLRGRVFVSPCSHIGGHKYAGNVIIFSSSINGAVTGHWYGYVTPDSVTTLLEQHVRRGKIVDSLWRGQMGCSEEEQVKSQQHRLQLLDQESDGEDVSEYFRKGQEEGDSTACWSEIDRVRCCLGNGNSSCCQNLILLHDDDEPDPDDFLEMILPEQRNNCEKTSLNSCSTAGQPSSPLWNQAWFENWEREDTYAALAVAAAAVSVVIAYRCCRQLW